MKITANKFQKYINDTFHAFSKHKSKLILNLHYIHTYFKDLADLIMNPVVQIPHKNEDNQRIINVPKPELLQLFSNVNKIRIHTTDQNGKFVYPMNKESVFRLLENIGKRHVEITIVAEFNQKLM